MAPLSETSTDIVAPPKSSQKLFTYVNSSELQPRVGKVNFAGVRVGLLDGLVVGLVDGLVDGFGDGFVGDSVAGTDGAAEGEGDVGFNVRASGPWQENKVDVLIDR